MQDKEEIRNKLSHQSLVKFDDITNSRVLGANCHIRLIGEIMLESSERTDLSVDERLDLVQKVATFFEETRGQQSRAIYNAIVQMVSHDESLPNVERMQLIRKQIQMYEIKAAENLNTLLEYACHISENMNSMMVFDYSSTVNEFIKKLDRKREIYVPESRALDGGKPYLSAAVEGGHDVHFIADTTMFVAMRKCQAVFMGAETIYPDGTVFNTIGSDIVAILCDYLKIPLYVLSPLVKVDTRPVQGFIRCSPMPFNYEQRLTKGWNEHEKAGIDFKGFKLLEIEPKLIKAIICEQGIIPTSAFFQIAMKYSERKGV